MPVFVNFLRTKDPDEAVRHYVEPRWLHRVIFRTSARSKQNVRIVYSLPEFGSIHSQKKKKKN